MRQLSFNLSIVNDVILEENEDFTASLTVSPADRTRLGNRVTVQPNVATITILDDDGTIAIIDNYVLKDVLLHICISINMCSLCSNHCGVC